MEKKNKKTPHPATLNQISASQDMKHAKHSDEGEKLRQVFFKQSWSSYH